MSILRLIGIIKKLYMSNIIELLPKVVSEGKKEANRILESLSDSTKFLLQTNELVIPSKDSNYKDLLKSWKTKFDEVVNRINEIDQEILAILDATKNQTTQEIATVHSNREKFKGYNLSNLKP